MRLKNKKILVTGAGGALGRAAALQMAQHGAAIACCDKREQAVVETVAAIHDQGGEAIVCVGDVADETSCQAMIAQAAEGLGGLNVLFNNAGIMLADDAGAVETPFSCMAANTGCESDRCIFML